MPPQMFTAKLADKQVLTPKFTHYTFEFVSPNTMTFEAGQYISLAVDAEGHRRSYSICSEPAKQHAFELLIDNTPNGLGVKFLEGLEFGHEANLLGPLGKFVITPEMASEPLVFVATGSGAAPFRSMVLDQLQKQSKVPMTLYMGLRYEEDMFWQDEWQRLQTQFANFHFHPTLSKPSQNWPLCRGRVTDCLTVHEQPPGAHYLICGNAPMLADVTELLKKAGVPDDHMHNEKFH